VRFLRLAAVRWLYSMADIEVPTLQWASSGGWAACDPCHELIERSGWSDLLARSMTGSGHGVPSAALRPIIGDLHAAFRRAWMGPGRRYVQES
jgi:hypothetical protein